MGRGAGNLNTELITSYLGGYNMEYIYKIAKDHIEPIRDKFKWGYDMKYYLTAINGCHPDYADALSHLSYDELDKKLKEINNQLFDRGLL